LDARKDEVLIALSIESDLRDAGAAVVQLVGSVIEAQRTIHESSVFDVAVVDLQLADGDAGPLIQILWEQGIPVVVATGAIVERNPQCAREGVMVLQKPYPEGKDLIIAPSKIALEQIKGTTTRRPADGTWEGRSTSTSASARG